MGSLAMISCATLDMEGLMVECSILYSSVLGEEAQAVELE